MSAGDDTIAPIPMGIVGQNPTFTVDGIVYQATSPTPNDGGQLTVQDATQIVASGGATPLAADYLSQFPWTKPPA